MANPQPPTPSGTAGAKRVTATLQQLNASHPEAAKRIVDDLIANGFTYDATVQIDLKDIATFAPTIAGTLDSNIRNPAVQYAMQYDFFHQLANNVGDALSPTLSGSTRVGQDIAKTALKGLNDFQNSLNPLAGLFQAHLWLRVAEVALGLLLLAVGVAKLTNAVPIATKIAGRLA